LNTSKKLKIVRWQAGSKPRKLTDDVACEEPLEIRVDNHPVSVTMRTPGNDEELAVGFLLSEGLLKDRTAVLKTRAYPRNPHGNVLNVFLAPDVVVDFAQLTRHVFASSSCGLCGKATIKAVQQRFPRIRKDDLIIDPELLLGLPEVLNAAQETFAKTGGLHAAAIFDLDGNLIALREDVGRHNAVDKVLGFCFLHNLLPLKRHILLVSGRTSFEILQKALAARVPIVAAVSAPSTLAAEFAQKSGQTLIGFLRGRQMNVYAHPERLAF
jgi:FdhD protein